VGHCVFMLLVQKLCGTGWDQLLCFAVIHVAKYECLEITCEEGNLQSSVGLRNCLATWLCLFVGP